MKKLNVKKISTVILVSITLPLVIVNTVNNLTSRKFVTNAAVGTITELAPQTANLAADMLDDMLTDMVDNAKSIGRNPIITDATVSEATRTREILLLKEEIGFIYSDGFSLQDGRMRDGSVVDAAIVNTIRNGGTYISSPTYDAQGNFRFYIYVPIYDAFRIYSEGESYEPTIVGGYRVEYDPIILSEALESCNLGDSGSAYIIDSAGVTIASSEDYEMVTRLENGYEEYLATGENEELAMHEKDMAEGKSSVYTYEFDGEDWTTGYTPIGDVGWSVAVELRNADFTGSVNTAVRMTVLIGAIILAIGFIVAIIVSTRISKPIKMVKDHLEDFADGHLPEKIEYNSSTEIGDMIQAVNTLSEVLGNVIRDIDSVLGTMAKGDLTAKSEKNIYVGDFTEIYESLSSINHNLQDAFRHIKESSDEVKSGSEQVSSAAQQLAQGTTEQAASIEELSATINDIYEQVRNNTMNAGEASRSCGMVSASMEESKQNMDGLTGAMQDISDKSSEISKIVKTIEDIAFQTNILALNAAVEAARAGAAGKGFAVVADEVRNLATKSSEAASMTTKLIADTVTAIENGNELTGKTSSAINSMIEETNTVIRLVAQIDDACVKQERAIAQVNIGIEQINAVVQTNSATAEESAAASTEMNEQANTLDSIISYFTTEEHTQESTETSPVKRRTSGVQKINTNDKYEL